MKLTQLTADADIVGRRVRVSWDFVLEDADTLADIPPVTLRRKLRDYEFPAPAAAASDPFLVYDSQAFPPDPVAATLTVTDLPTWETTNGGGRTVFEPVSVAVAAAGRMVEILRRTTATVYDPSGMVVKQTVEILDVGGAPGALAAGIAYYYQLFSLDLPATGDDAQPFRDSVTVTDAFGTNRTLYLSLPEVFRRHDVTNRSATAGSDSVPESSTNFGQLRRFVDLFGVALDSVRGTADGLRTLHDVNAVDARYLSLLAGWIGWDLTVGVDVPVRRNEIKSASRLYRLVGTLPGLRALVNQFTGWFAQAAEMAQNLALANRPPQRNLFAITRGAGGTWQGVDDAAELLGFGIGNRSATGAIGVAASLTGTVVEPFALRPGMALAVTVDGLLPVQVRFSGNDFDDITQARAAEVALAIHDALPEVAASAAGGHVVLASATAGSASAIEVQLLPTTLVSLESAPRGRISPIGDSLGRQRVFYEAWKTPTTPESATSVSGPPQPPNDAGGFAIRRARYKTFVDGAWRDSHAIFEQGSTAEGDVAAFAMPDDRTWAAWVDGPQSGASRLRYTLGASRLALPAKLVGQNAEPFNLTAGAVLTLTGDFAGVDVYTVAAADFARLDRATAAEVVTAMNAQLVRVRATRERNGALRLETIATGDRARLRVDLSRSTTARVLGFGPRNTDGTAGAWDDEIDWTAPLDFVSVPAGRHAEPSVAADPAGGARVAWATHFGGLWRITTAVWRERVVIATAAGVFVGAADGTWSTLGGLPSADVRALAADGDGTLWIATGAGVALLTAAGIVTAPSPALPFTDVRDVAPARDGAIWFATSGGVGVRSLTGVTTVTTTAGGLPSNDVRAIAVADDGTVWAATALGAAALAPGGPVTPFGAGSGLPSLDLRDVAVAPDGSVYFATGAGLAIRARDGAFTVADTAAGLPSADVHAVALANDGGVWVATPKGAAHLAGGTWTSFDTSVGLGSGDVRTVALGPDGLAWIGTAAGVTLLDRDEAATRVDFVGGGAPNPAVRAVHTGWSAPRELSAGGGGNREASVAIDATNRAWVVWSQRVGAGNPDESWTLRFRVFDRVAGAWGAETALTKVPAGGRVADRTPTVQAIATGVRVYFSSDRNSDTGLWSVDVTAAGVIGALVAITTDTSSDLAPAPMSVGAATWLLYRSDRNVALTQVGTSPTDGDLPRSIRVPDNGTLRRYAGSISVTPTELQRLATRRTFGDLLVYTPNRPAAEAPLVDDELYTRGTVVLYVSRADQGSPLTLEEGARLRELLDRFIPINLRVVVILRAGADVELVYSAGADITESYHDEVPSIEAFDAITDTATASMPELSVLISNTAGDVSVDPADLTTLRQRTFFPPVQ